MSDLTRHQPAGAQMGHHFTSPDDQRSHIERLNPVGGGVSPSDGTGAAGVTHKPILPEILEQLASTTGSTTLPELARKSRRTKTDPDPSAD